MFTAFFPGRPQAFAKDIAPPESHPHSHTALIVASSLVACGLALPWLGQKIREGREEGRMRRLIAAHPSLEKELRGIAMGSGELDKYPELASDVEVAKMAVAKDGYALQHVPAFQNNAEVVKLACAQSGYALQFASPELRSDREVVLAAVAQVAYAFQYASEEIRGSEEVVRQAVKSRGNCLEFASEALRKNRDVVKVAVAEDANALGGSGWVLAACSFCCSMGECTCCLVEFVITF